MKNKESYFGLIVGIVLGVSIMGIVICFTIGKISLANKTYSADVKSNSNNDITVEKSNNTVPVYEFKQKNDENVNNNSYQTAGTENFKVEKSVSEATTTNNTVTDNNQSSNSNISKSTKEEASNKIVTYAEKVENDIFTEEDVNKVLKIAKEEFIKITDFVFYGTEINGYTFQQLTDSAKLHITNIVIEIDAMLEEVRPGYKNEIKLGVNNVIEKATIKYLEISNKVCTELGPEACSQAKKDFQVMRESLGLTLDLAKNLTKQGLQSLKEWYEIFRKSN